MKRLLLVALMVLVTLVGMVGISRAQTSSAISTASGRNTFPPYPNKEEDEIGRAEALAGATAVSAVQATANATSGAVTELQATVNSGVPDAVVEADRGLVGAWIITANRARGVGKNLLTFSSDGTFFRSGDTHPVYSGGHGAWKRVGDREFDATYIAFLFEQNGKWIGSNKVLIHIVQGPGDNEFTAATRTSTRDLQDNEITASEGRLSGKRIQVEPF